jgi:hypothetical protein
MGRERVSRRLAGKSPSAEKPLKRVRRGNKNSLTDSTKQQAEHAVSRRCATGTRRRAKGSKSKETSQSLAKPPATPIPDSEPAGETPQATPLPNRKRVTGAPAPSSPPAFNPNIEQKHPHNVSLLITPVIDHLRKGDKGICHNIDISDIFRDDLSKLYNLVYERYVKEWEDIRKVTPAEKPRLQYWLVTVSNPSGRHHTLCVTDEVSWNDVLIVLRQTHQDGGIDRKNAHKLAIDAVYKTFDRTTTPPAPKSKTESKTRPETVRITNLNATPEPRTSDIDGEGEEEEEDNDNDP